MKEKENLLLPNFICIGAQKTGTTTLYHILKEHDEITVSKPRKETKFFYRDSEYKRGLKYYSEFFSYAPPKKVIGEIDPDYLYFPYIANRINKDLGNDMKFIIILRNPVDRAFSQYHMSVRMGFEKLNFKEAIEKEFERLKSGNSIEQSNFSYISRGLYDQQIERYFKLFARNNFLLINYDTEFKPDLAGTLKNIYRFLDISNVDLELNIKENSAAIPKSELLVKLIREKNSIKTVLKKIISNPDRRRYLKKKIINWNRKDIVITPLDNELRYYLYKKYFADSINNLEKLTAMDFSLWKEKEL
ncbi:hypothetical protein LBMAG27_07790 [Bacteroidota bacterium]|nr:hypothetical protein LBMAG27_07790 [Bacteroidota bacterium]